MVETPEAVAALGRPMLGHLDPDFLEIMDETMVRLRTVFRTDNALITAANVAGEFRTVNVPLVFWEQALLRLDREALADNGVAVAGATAINIVNTIHPITQGLTAGNLAVFSAGSNLSVGQGNLAPTAGARGLRMEGARPGEHDRGREESRCGRGEVEVPAVARPLRVARPPRARR